MSDCNPKQETAPALTFREKAHLLQHLPPNHPVWSMLRVIVLTACACVTLVVTASHFDTTELTALAGIGGSAAVIEFVKRKVAG